MNLSQEEGKLYEEIKGVYNDLTGVGEKFGVKELKIMVGHYISAEGWIGRQSWWLIPAVLSVGFGMGYSVALVLSHG